MSSKAQRHHLMEQLISNTEIVSQKQLRELMANEGFLLSQVTVSRDLQELGAIKVRSGDSQRYAIPELAAQRSTPTDVLARVCREWVVKVGCSQNMVVLTTPPGSAHVVASAIDRSALDSVLGTVAGDDTIFMVATSAAAGVKLAARFAGLANLSDLSGHTGYQNTRLAVQT